jgi:hypothetical protein
MVDDGDDGGFVFGEERSTDTDATGGRASRRTIAAAVLFVALVTLVATYPFASSAVTGLFAGGSDRAGGGSATTDSNSAAGETIATESVSAPPETSTTAEARTSKTATQTPTATSTTTRTPDPPTATATQTATDTPTPTPTATATDTTTPTATNTPTPTATATTTSVAPTVESFTVTDRSDEGTGRFAVGWNVTDADGDLVAVRVRLVADPDSEARTVAQRRFDAGGAQSSGEATFEVADGSGAAYALSIEVVDTNDNTAFELTRVVADGSPDG